MKTITIAAPLTITTPSCVTPEPTSWALIGESFCRTPEQIVVDDRESEPPYYQQLMFLPAGQDKEKYNPKEYRTLLRKHLNDRAKKVKPSRRNSDAGESGTQSHPCDGNAFEAAKVDMGEEGRT